MNNSLFLKALACLNDGRPPIWMMRQAGRHLASYRKLRERYSFLEMCHHPQLIAEVTALPIHAYQMDAAILFSDILMIPEAMQVGLQFDDKLGPIIERPVSNREEINALPEPEDLYSLRPIIQGIELLKQTLSVPLIGFCGAPFTLASYMIEGKTSKNFKKTKQMMLRDPESFHLLLDKLARWAIAFLKKQIHAGVNAIQIFDSWANILAYRQFHDFSLYYMEKILNGIRETNCPTILFCRGSSYFAPALASINPSAISLDWSCQLSDIRSKLSYPITLQGNLDPDFLYAPLHSLKEEVNRLLDQMKGDKGFIFNLGHGVAPDVSEDAVRTVVDCIKQRQ
jgi:uroporphyrinogen decarboxylase